MAEKANPIPSSDEKLFAMLSHFSIFLGGIILPIIFWAIKKDQSQFVRFHSLQSIFFHIAYFVLIMVFVVIVMIIAIFGAGLSAVTLDSGGSNAAPPMIMLIFMGIFYLGLFAVIFGAIGYGIYGGIKSYQGELFMYPVIGKKVYEKVYGGR